VGPAWREGRKFLAHMFLSPVAASGGRENIKRVLESFPKSKGAYALVPAPTSFGPKEREYC